MNETLEVFKVLPNKKKNVVKGEFFSSSFQTLRYLNVNDFWGAFFMIFGKDLEVQVPNGTRCSKSADQSIRIHQDDAKKSLKRNLPNLSQKVGVVFWRQGRTRLNRPNLCPWCSGCCFVHEHPFWFFFGNVRTRNGANVKPKAVCFLCYCYLATTSMDKI